MIRLLPSIYCTRFCLLCPVKQYTIPCYTVNMTINALPPASTPLFPDAPRQRDFLRRLQPLLVEQPWLAALWLTGSPAQARADRWSSVDLHCLVTTGRDVVLMEEHLAGVLAAGLVQGWTRFGGQGTEQEGWLEGISHARQIQAGSQGAVCFRFAWCMAESLDAHLARHGPLRLLWAGADLPEGSRALLARSTPPWRPAEGAKVMVALTDFWQQLARLPAVVNRGEHLAGAALLQRVRSTLTDLVVALNGATRPHLPTRVNPFLGPAQREAFEKSLVQRGDLAESWIGQAVALIVLYRWYAPQLVEQFGLDYPLALEESVLALLRVEIPGWPVHITTA